MSSARPSKFAPAALTEPGRVRLYSTAELLRQPAPSWLVEGTIPAKSLVGLYSPPGEGKTFVSLDIALSVASGIPWQGHATTEDAYVLYISAEGGSGIGKRVQAWLTDRTVSVRKAEMAWLIESIPVHADSDDMDTLIERVQYEVGRHPDLVVIDTLARCFDGDENLQLDMGRFIAGVDRLRLAWGSTVMVVHHTRLAGDRERGNTAFRGAADTMIALERIKGTRPGVHGLVLTCNKQKDAEEFEPIKLRLVTVEGTDSCVIQPWAAAPAQGGRPRNQGFRDRVLSALREAGAPLTWSAWWRRLEQPPKSTFSRTVGELTANGCVQRTSDDTYAYVRDEPLEGSGTPK